MNTFPEIDKIKKRIIYIVSSKIKLTLIYNVSYVENETIGKAGLVGN